MLSYSKLMHGIFSSDLRPSGSVNRLGGPKQVILSSLGECWVEKSPLGVSSFSTTHPGSNSIS